MILYWMVPPSPPLNFLHICNHFLSINHCYRRKTHYTWVREESKSLPLTQWLEGHCPGHSFPLISADAVRVFVLLYWNSQEGRRVLQLHANLPPYPHHKFEKEHRQRVRNRGLKLKGTMHTNWETLRNCSNKVHPVKHFVV